MICNAHVTKYYIKRMGEHMRRRRTIKLAFVNGQPYKSKTWVTYE